MWKGEIGGTSAEEETIFESEIGTGKLNIYAQSRLILLAVIWTASTPFVPSEQIYEEIAIYVSLKKIYMSFLSWKP